MFKFSVLIKINNTQVCSHQSSTFTRNLFKTIDFYRKNGKLLINNTAGHLLRSKPDDENEGGVTVGIAAIDSPLLQ